jgi:hypothetical protein
MTEPPPSFAAFLSTLQQLTAPPAPVVPKAREPYGAAASALQSLPEVTQEALSKLIKAHPNWVPMLASACGLSREQLRGVLRHQLGTSGWIKIAREQPQAVIDLLDNDYELVVQIETERNRAWSYGDVLFERVESRSRAGRAQQRGRQLEDAVENVVKSLGLPYVPRTQFIGRAGQSAPSDLAIPADGPNALIVVAAKAFNSTGSKLTDATREIESMASVRLPTQFVYAVIDGIGWLRRQNDLRKIHTLWTERSIDGVFSLAQLGEFREQLVQAAAIHHLA